jgi:hypothetical protein
MNSLLGSFFAYLKHPAYRDDVEDLKSSAKFRNIFKLWSFSIVITFFVGILSAYLINKTGYDESKHSVVDLFLNYPIVVFMLLAFVWGPITEELSFRMCLKYSSYRLGFASVFLLSMLASIFLELVDNINQKFGYYVDGILEKLGFSGLLYYLLFIMIGGVVLGWIFEKKLSRKRMVEAYKRNFAFIFYFFSTMFAIMHLLNFQGFSQIWFLAPLLVMPQFILGLVLAYARMNYGLKWAIFTHFIHNALITAPVIIFSLLSDDLLASIESESNIDAINISMGDSLLVLSSLGFTLIILLMVIFSFIFLLKEYLKKRKLGIGL